MPLSILKTTESMEISNGIVQTKVEKASGYTFQALFNGILKNFDYVGNINLISYLGRDLIRSECVGILYQSMYYT